MTEPDVTTERPATSPQAEKRKTFSKAAGSVLGTAFGITAGALAGVTVVVAAVAFVASGAATDIFNTDQYQDRIDAINAVYRQGAKTRAELNRSGTTLANEAMCADAYQRTGAYKEAWYVDREHSGSGNDQAFAELRRLSFINGCLGRPNELPATPLPPTPTPSPSASR